MKTVSNLSIVFKMTKIDIKTLDLKQDLLKKLKG